MTMKSPKTSTRLLHKYRPWKDATPKRELDQKTQTLLERGEIYFAPPKDFNDPFDSQFSLPNTHGDTENIRQKFADRINKFMGVFSVSWKNDRILMWSHYGDSHRGLCIGINPDAIKELVRQYKAAGSQNKIVRTDMIYEKEYPNLSFDNDDASEDAGIVLKHKFKQWDYEKEHRVILIRNDAELSKTKALEKNDRLLLLPNGAITEIVFGIEFPRDERKKVKALTARKFPNIEFFQAVRQEQKYAINLDPISI